MDEKVIKGAAEEAVNDLQLDCRVEAVARHPRHSEKWCVQFSGEYGQFCDEFRNKSGEDNSPEVMREKIKRFFIKIRRPVRVRRASPRHDKKGGEQMSLSSPLEIVREALGQTTRLVGEAINQVSGLARTALETEAEVSIEMPVAVAVPPPRRPHQKRTAKRSPGKSARKTSGKTARKVSPRKVKPSSKSSKAAKKSVRKARPAAAKKKAAKKGARKK